MALLQSWFSHAFCIVEDNLVLHNTNGKIMILKMPSVICYDLHV